MAAAFRVLVLLALLALAPFVQGTLLCAHN